MDQVDQLAWAYPQPDNSKQASASVLFYHVVLFLRGVGVLPVKTARLADKNHGPIIRYIFSIKSLTFFYCFILTTFIMAFWGQFVAEFTNNNLFSTSILFANLSGNASTPKKDLLNPLMVSQTLLLVIFPVSSAGNIMATIWTSSDFVEYLNTWTTFEKKFRQIFNIHPFLNEAIFPRTTSFRRFSWNIAIFIAVLMGLSIYPMLQSQERLFNSNVTMSWPIMVGSLITILIMLLVDLRSNLMLFINEEAFSQIGDNIHKKIEDSQKFLAKIQASVQDWQVLISDARNQTISVGKILSTNLLMELINLFCVWCSVIYQTVFFAQKEGFSFFKDLGPNYFMCGIMYIRLAVKVFLSERIGIAEAQIVKSIRLMEIHPSDCTTSLETNIVVDWIATTPSKINIANLFALNRSLLFGVMGQTLTYVLVLLQFQTIQGA